MNPPYLKLCLVTHRQGAPLNAYKDLLRASLQSGVTSVQLREKGADLELIRHLSLELLSALSPFNIPLIINDHLEIAKEVNAQGVHLGQSDVSPLYARKLLGPDKIIGLSVENFEQLEQANQLSCINYIAASAVFPSATKLDCKTIWGVQGLKKLAQASKHPVIAIGGINQSNIAKVIQAGACGAAVISAIHEATDPRRATANLILEIEKSIANRSDYV